MRCLSPHHWGDFSLREGVSCSALHNSVTQNPRPCCRPTSCTSVGMEESQVCVTIPVPQMRGCAFFLYMN